MNFWKNPEYQSIKVLIVVVAVFGIGAFALSAMRGFDLSGRVVETKNISSTKTGYNIQSDTTGIRDLQKYLQDKSYYTGNLDGTLNSATNEAISLWQKELGIVPTGKISKDWKPVDRSMMPPEDEVYTPCDVDFNQNGVVDVSDLLFLMRGYETPPGDSIPQDINGSGSVDILDLLIFIQFYGQMTGDCNAVSCTSNTWTQKADFGGYPGAWYTGFSTTSKGYMGSYDPNFYKYDPITDVWTQNSNSPEGFPYGAVGFTINDNGFIGIGNGLSNFYEYNTDTSLWTQKASYPGGASSGVFGASIGNKGYAGTGYGTDIHYKDFWEYDSLSNTWTQKADFGGVERLAATGFTIGDKIYMGTGYSVIGGVLTFYKDFWEYNPATDTWTQKADFGGSERAVAVGFSIGSKGYIGTGKKTTDSINIHYKDFWEYNPATDTWTQKADFGGVERGAAAGFSIDGKGYIGTGKSTQSFYKDFWEYCP